MRRPAFCKLHKKKFIETITGTAIAELKANAEIHIADSDLKVGTVGIDLALQVSLHSENQRIKGNAEITRLNLTDKDNSLGLPQDALDNLGSLGKEMLAKVSQFLLFSICCA